jgi:hypothetical protein
LAAKLDEEPNQLPSRHVLIKAEFAGKIANLLPGRHALLPAIVPGDEGSARRGTNETQQETQGRGLSGAVRTKQAEYLTGSHLKVQIVQSGDAALVTFAQVFGAQKHVGPSTGDT